jgi:SAM-dependent methyltransferase/DNA-directed RNA polymerase subunit RPC12/RpoP
MIIEKLLSEEYRFNKDLPLSGLTPSQIEAKRLFLKEIHEKDRYIHVEQCPYCGSDIFLKVSEIEVRGLPCEIVICKNCDGCFKPNVLNQETSAYYHEKIHSLLIETDPLQRCSLFDKRVVLYANARFHFVSNLIKLKPGRDLIAEFGCGDGANLIPWKDRGYDVIGIDFNAEMVKVGRNKGLNLVCGDFLDYDFLDGRPSLVILSHVLNHVTDLNAAVQKAYVATSPDGFVFVETPNIRSWDLVNTKRLFTVDTNYYLDLKSLSAVLERCRFNIAYADEYIRVLCTPRRDRVRVMRPHAFSFFDKLKIYPFKWAIDAMQFSNRRLYNMLEKAERGDIANRILNQLYKLYFRSLYGSIENISKGKDADGGRERLLNLEEKSDKRFKK